MNGTVGRSETKGKGQLGAGAVRRFELRRRIEVRDSYRELIEGCVEVRRDSTRYVSPLLPERNSGNLFQAFERDEKPVHLAKDLEISEHLAAVPLTAGEAGRQHRIDGVAQGSGSPLQSAALPAVERQITFVEPPAAVDLSPGELAAEQLRSHRSRASSEESGRLPDGQLHGDAFEEMLASA